MATSEHHGNGQILDNEDSNAECTKEWPLTYVRETKECVCGWCGQVILSTHTTEDIETHFKSCKSSKDNGLSMIFKELRKMKQKMERSDDDVQLKVDKKIAEVKAEILNIKKEFNKEISDLKSEIKNDLEREMKSRDEAFPTLFWKVKALEEKITAMGVAQEVKMAEVSGRVSGVAETISTAVRSILEAKGSSSAESALLKKETEALWAQMRVSERDIQSLKTGLEDERAHLKTEMETVTEQLKTTDRDLRVIEKQLEDEKAKNESSKMTSFHVEPSPFQQSSIPMNCANLVVHNYLFQPCFRWTIEGIGALTGKKMSELSSELFQWNGYPVQARAKLQLKEDDIIYMSLSLKDVLKDDGQAKAFKPIPYVFYLLKDKAERNPRHICQPGGYLSNTNFSYSLNFNRSFVHKSCFNRSSYNVNDSVEVEIYVEPSSMTQHAHSFDGTLEWNIENYAKRLHLAKDDLVPYLESPYFYTGPSGYRVQVKMFLDEEGGRSLFARISFLTGKFDTDLPQSFLHSTTVTLINRKDPERSIKKTIVEVTGIKKEFDFEMCKVEEVADLIEKDTLFCKVIIKLH